MTVIKNLDGDRLTIELSGRLDTNTSPQLEAELSSSIGGVKQLTLDFKGIEYISSAGLRVLLQAQKIMNTQGSMRLKNVNSGVMEIFEITGFADILTVE
ncbi:MAG: STAS domain-containing protein [Candidatus Coproplasma sp.]